MLKTQCPARPGCRDQKKPDSMPPFLNGTGFTEGTYLQADGKAKTMQDKILFGLLTNDKRADLQGQGK